MEFILPLIETCSFSDDDISEYPEHLKDFMAHYIMRHDSQVFKENKWNFVFSATKFSYPIQRAFRKLETGGVEKFEPKYFQARSQDLIEAYHDAGQFYWGKEVAWSNLEQLFGPDATICELPVWRVQDIDTSEDWKRAEMLFELLKKKNNENSN